MDSTPASSDSNSHAHSHWPVVIALIASVAAGALLQMAGYHGHDGSPEWTVKVVEVCQFLGTLFMRALKMVIVPLVVTSIIAGIAGLSTLEGFGRMGLKTTGYYLASSLVAILIGLMVVNTIQPGRSEGKPNPTLVTALETARNSAGAEKSRAVVERTESGTAQMIGILERMIPTNVFEAAARDDLLGLIFFSILFAVAMVCLPGGPPAALRDSINQISDVMTLVTVWIMRLAPVGIFGLVTVAVAETGFHLFADMAKWVFTVVLALGLHFLVAIPLGVWLLAGVSPRRHFAAMQDALLMAFSTASSSATVPVTLRCMRENAGVSPRVSSFTIPLGATVNMDGTALYECTSVIFISQVLGMEMSILQQFIVVFLALLTSIGVAGIPSASLVAILIIMRNVGMSDEAATASLSLLLTVDRPLDMARTAVNVFSDATAAVIVAKSEGELLMPEK